MLRRIPWLRRESPVKGATRRYYAQVSIEHHKGLPDGVNDGLRQAVPVRQFGQRVAIRHAGRFFIHALDFNRLSRHALADWRSHL